MNDTEVITESPVEADAARPRGRPPKAKTVPVLLYHDVWIDDGTGTAVRLRTNIKKLDENGMPIFDAKKGDYVKEQVVHDLPLDIARVVIDSGKGARRDPLPGE